MSAERVPLAIVASEVKDHGCPNCGSGEITELPFKSLKVCTECAESFVEYNGLTISTLEYGASGYLAKLVPHPRRHLPAPDWDKMPERLQ